MSISDEQRTSYKQAAAIVANLELDVRPAIMAIEAEAGLPAARTILAEIVDEIGEPFATCEGCSAHIFDGDEYGADEDGDIYACAACIERWGGAGWAERDDVEECAKAHDASKAGAPQ
jgi:hypothetical protein